MSKGGHYLQKKDTKKETKKGKKKGRVWKILLTIVLVLAVIAGAGYVALRSYYYGLLGQIPRGEIVDQGASVEDIMDAATYNPDRETMEQTEPVPEEPSAEETTGGTLPQETTDPGQTAGG